MTTRTIRELVQERSPSKGTEFVEANSNQLQPWMAQYAQYEWPRAHSPFIAGVPCDPNETVPEAETKWYATNIDTLSVSYARCHRTMAQQAKVLSDAISKFLDDPSPISNGAILELSEYLATVERYGPIAEVAQENRSAMDEQNERIIQEAARRYYLVQVGGDAKIYCVETDEWMDIAAAKNINAHARLTYVDGKRTYEKNIIQALIESAYCRVFKFCDFDPSQSGHYQTQSGQNVFNFWQGFSTKATAGNDDAMFWELLGKMCDGNEDYFEYITKWLAHMIQRPGELPGTYIGVSGPAGVGKNTLWETVGALMRHDRRGSVLGQGAYGYFTNYDEVFGQYNPKTAAKLFLILDETTWAGSNALKARMKTAITGETFSVNQKYVKQFDLTNYRRFVLISNEGNYVNVDPDDRRLLPLEFKEEHRPDPEWFNEFHRLRDEGDMLPNLMHRLMTIDIAGWRADQALRRLPITTGEAIRHGSMEGWRAWMNDIITEGIVSVSDRGQVSEVPLTGFIPESTLKSGYKHEIGKDGWNQPEFANMRDKIFGTKVQRAGGIRGRTVPTDVADRWAKTFRWKVQMPAVAPPTKATAKVVDLMEYKEEAR